MITSIGYLQFFEEAFVMTKGGPLDSTRSITYFAYDQFGFGNYGVRLALRRTCCSSSIVVLTAVQFRAAAGEGLTMAQILEPAPSPPAQTPAAPTKRPKSRDGNVRTPGGCTP